jgi:flagellar L-ring protein precursor FlgH
MNKKNIFLVLAILFLTAACAGRQGPDPGARAGDGKKDPEPEIRIAADTATDPEFKSQPRHTGSLWQDGSTSLYAANKATRVGDIVTVAIYERASAEKEAETATGRSSSTSFGIPKLLGYEAALAGKNPNLDPGSLISASSDNSFMGTGSTSREERLSATLTTRVMETVEGGNLRIEGTKTVRVNNEDQIIKLSGIIRPADITEYNTIDSQYILDARIEYSGDGIISEKQRPGWLARLMDVAWPF